MRTDPYPTFYRFNDQRTVTAAAQKIGMEIVEFHLVEKEPSYGMSSRLMFLLFMGYERTVNSSEQLRSFRSNIFAALETPPSQEQKLDKIYNADLHGGQIMAMKPDHQVSWSQRGSDDS